MPVIVNFMASPIPNQIGGPLLSSPSVNTIGLTPANVGILGWLVAFPLSGPNPKQFGPLDGQVTGAGYRVAGLTR